MIRIPAGLALALALAACSETGAGGDGGADGGPDTESADTETGTGTGADTGTETSGWENPGCDAPANVVADGLRLKLRVELTDVANDVYDIVETATVTPAAAGEALTLFGEQFGMGEASAGYAYDGHAATFCVGPFGAGEEVSVEARFRVTAASQAESMMGTLGLAARWDVAEVVVGPFTEPYHSPRWILSPQSLHDVDPVHDDSPAVEAVELTVVAPGEGWTVVGPGGHAAVDGLEHSFGMDEPMPLYALSFAASPDYETFEVGEAASGVRVWAAVTPSALGAAEDYFPAAIAAIDAMERDIGPYAWGDTLFLAEVPGLSGGMEHTSAIWLGSDVLVPDYGEFVVVHETVHHWWGDAVRFADWPHFWLAEGFDEWSTNFVVLADVYGEAEFEANKLAYHDYAAMLMCPEWGGAPGPLRFEDERDMDDVFGGGPSGMDIYVYYYYGAVFLEMVNRRLVRDFGTDLLTVLAGWYDGRAMTATTTEELLAFLGEETGDAEYWGPLFDDWVYKSPLPTLRYSGWSYSGGVASFTLTRAGGAGQGLDDLEVVFAAGGAGTAVAVDLPAGVDAVTVSAATASEPDDVVVDPEFFYVLRLEELAGWGGPPVHTADD